MSSLFSRVATLVAACQLHLPAHPTVTPALPDVSILLTTIHFFLSKVFMTAFKNTFEAFFLSEVFMACYQKHF